MALTDHDTVAGVAEAQEAAHRFGLDYLTGTEISTGYHRREVHVVGLGIDTSYAPLLETLNELSAQRGTRAERIVARLNELGVPVSLDAVRARGGASVGRLHIAQEIHALGCAKTVQGAFDKYIGAGKRAFVPKVTLPIEEALRLIHEAGGLAFLAHPGIGTNRGDLPKLLRLPFDGLEAYHSQHSAGQIEQFSALAREHGLLIGGGSDCHGGIKNTPLDMGRVRLPYACYAAIRDCLAA